MRPSQRIILEVARERCVDPSQLTRPCRIKRVFRARAEVARRLHALGYSTTRIGAVLRHNHTTIYFYLGLGKKRPTPEPAPRWRKPHIAFLSRIKPLSPEHPEPQPPKPRKLYLQPYAGADMTNYGWKERRT